MYVLFMYAFVLVCASKMSSSFSRRSRRSQSNGVNTQASAESTRTILFTPHHEEDRNPDFLQVQFRPDPNNPGAFGQVGAGAAVRTMIQKQLDRPASILIATIDHYWRALQRAKRREMNAQVLSPHQAMGSRGNDGHRKNWLYDRDALARLFTGSAFANFENLLRKGRVAGREIWGDMSQHARKRHPRAEAVRLMRASDEGALIARLEDLLRRFRILEKGASVDIERARGLRHIAGQIEKGRLPTDVTFQERIGESARTQANTRPSLCDMTELTLITGVNAARIWPSIWGDPKTFDGYRFFELAILAHRIENDEMVEFTPEMARYFLCEFLQILLPRVGTVEPEGFTPAKRIICEAFDQAIEFKDLTTRLSYALFYKTPVKVSATR